MSQATTLLTDENHETVFQQKKYTIIDSWTETCAPCKAISPLFDKLAEQFHNKITFAKLNTDENRGLQRKLRIMSVPTFIVLERGNLVTRWTGANTGKLQKTVEEFVNKS